MKPLQKVPRVLGRALPGARCQGFTLLEMLIGVLLLSLVMAAAVGAMKELMQRNSSQSSKVDTVQETRDFIDQMIRDIHGTGYPPPRVTVLTVGTSNTCADGSGNINSTIRNNTSMACGLVSWSPTSMVYEGDLDGTGTVSAVYLNLATPAGSTTCPCVLQRGVETKTQELNNQTPQYFTEVNGVLNSGNGNGSANYSINLPFASSYTAYSTADAFDAYDVNGNRLANGGGTIVTSCSLTTNPDCSSIRSVQITANVTSSFADPTTQLYPVFSITSKARLNF